MSIVQIKNRTTNSIEDFSKNSSSSNSYIYTSASVENIEHFSIEITLGEGWNDNYSEADVGLRKINDSITVSGRGSIVVEIAEDISVPFNRYGIVLPTGSLFLAQGILIASAKIEPAFSGRLKLRLFNTTDKKIKIAKGRKLGSVIFFSTDATILQDVITRNSNISVPQATQISVLLGWFTANKTTWIGWLVTAVVPWSLTIFMYFSYYMPSLNSKQNNELSFSQKRQPPTPVLKNEDSK